MQIEGAIKSLERKKFTLGPNSESKVAVFNVGDAKRRCEVEGYPVEIKTTGETYDPSHTGMYGFEHSYKDVAAILAVEVDLTLYRVKDFRQGS